MQRPSDPQVFMVTGTVWHPRCPIQSARFKAIGVKFVVILTTWIYYQLKNLWFCLKSGSMRVLHKNVLFLQPKDRTWPCWVRVKWERSLWEFYGIQLSVDVDGCWEMKTWLDQLLVQICERLGFWKCILKLVSSYSYICNFYDGVVQNHRPQTTDHGPPTTDHILIKTPTTDQSQK